MKKATILGLALMLATTGLVSAQDEQILFVSGNAWEDGGFGGSYGDENSVQLNGYLSGPLVDRFDIVARVPRVESTDMAGPPGGMNSHLLSAVAGAASTSARPEARIDVR